MPVGVDFYIVRRSSYLLVYFSAWTAIGVFFATQTYIGAWYSDRPLSWSQAFAVALVAWYLRALLAPGVFWMAHRFRISSEIWFRNTLVHAAGSITFAIIEQMLFNVFIFHVRSIPRRSLSSIELHVNLLTYWALLGVALLIDYYRRNRQHELAASRLNAELATAKLDLLRAQLRPHFLFNALNGISELMYEDVEQADVMLGHLSDMLRSSLEHTEKREVRLSEEIEFLRRYLEIQRMRFQDRLEFQISTPPDLLSCWVPYLILQPLVENAILHGIASSPSPGRVVVHVIAQDEKMRIEIRDNGPGLPLNTMKEGLGMQNTRLRLLHTYGTSSNLYLANGPEGGAQVTVELPIRLNDSEESRSLKAN